MSATHDAARRAAEEVARHSFSRLRAYLTARWRDVAAAEDALADALRLALERWPVDGVPHNPEGWLMTVAKNRLRDAARHRSMATLLEPDLIEMIEALHTPESEAFPDERLQLLFVCAHPAIDAAVRAPLMLQVVLGLDVPRIASALLLSPEALMKRLTRAKAKIREAGIAFELPELEALPERLLPVLDALYGAYTLGRDDPLTEDSRRRELGPEAIWLCRVVQHLLPGQPEVMGLLALLLFSEARQPARREVGSARFVPLAQQDIALWDLTFIEEAEQLLREAGRLAQPGPYQLEAAIQAVHAARRQAGYTDWAAIRLLYQGLCARAPTLGARVGAAVAAGESGDWRLALRELGALDAVRVAHYQPYWAARAHALRALGEQADAAIAYWQAAALSEDASVRRYLLDAAQALSH